MTTPRKKIAEVPTEGEVLRRMLNTPPQPHKPKVKAAAKPKQKRRDGKL